MSLRDDPRTRHVALLKVGDVAELLGLHPRTVWRMAASGDLPQPVKLSERAVRWRLRDIEKWLERK
jgi:predicted DNA-binding transcriptional regulator AlpA